MKSVQATIHGSPSFAYLDVELAPGESIVTESDAMASMAADLDLEAKFNGGFFTGLARKFLGGESLFVSVFTNRTTAPKRITLAQATPGDLREVRLSGGAIGMQPGAYVASTPGIEVSLQYAGLRSLIAREGLFRLLVSGTGTVWYGAYGGLLEREVNGEYLVDTAHLVSYDPSLRLRLQLAGGLLSSLFGGEGLVMRIEGKGKIVIQTRSLSGLVRWLNPKIF
jgi:uncharacterized protein (TIGR00266 family)